MNRQSSITKHHSEGLTFVELLIAATMFSVLVVGVSSHLSGGINVWRRSTQATEQAQRVRVMLARLSGDLANALVVDERQEAKPKPQFLADQMAFFTVEPSRTGDPQDRKVLYVSYELEGRGESQALVRRSQTYQEARVDSSAPARTTVMLPLVEAFQIRYAYKSDRTPEGWEFRGTWQKFQEWQPDDQLPRFIEVTVKQSTPSDPSERFVEPVELTTILTIPSGILKQEQPPAP